MANNFVKHVFFTLILIGVFIVIKVDAATLQNASITPVDTTVSVEANYTIQFDAVSAFTSTTDIVITSLDGDNSRFTFGLPGYFKNAILPNTFQLAVVPKNNFIEARAYNTTALAVVNGTTVKFIIDNVKNPSTAGAVTYRIDIYNQRPDNGGTIVDTVTLAPITYTAAAGPVVDVLISNQTIFEDDGASAVDLDAALPVNTDLNYIFSDDNGETLSFTIDSVVDASVVTATISGNQLILAGLKTGSTDVTVRASDTSSNSVTDTFTVNSIGVLTPASVTPTSLLAADATIYTISFQPAVAIGAGDKVFFSGGGALFNAATLGSISGGTLSVSNLSVTNGAQDLLITFGGSASISDTVSIVINGVLNPGSGGQSADYTLRTQSGVVNGQSTITGNTFTAINVPTVANLIPGVSFNQEDGAITKDLDATSAVNTNLNFTFVDGDSDPMTFTIEAGHDTAVVTAVVNANDEIVLTGQGTGTTTVTVKADDLQDGSITTSFSVSVLGDLAPATVLPASLFSGATTSYIMTLTPNIDLGVDDKIRFDTFAEFDQTSSSLMSLSGGSITGTKTSGNSSVTTITINSGSITAGSQITLELSGIINPSSLGMSADYQIYTENVASANTGVSTVTGSVFVVQSDNIFINGFESTVVVVAAKHTVALVNRSDTSNQPPAKFDEDTQKYMFMNNSLSLKHNSKVRTMDEVMKWFRDVLTNDAPAGDFDLDGIVNEFDSDPFGILKQN